MTTAQINVCQRPTIYLGTFSASRHRVLKPSNLALHAGQVPWTQLKLSSNGAPRGLNYMPLLKSHRSSPVCMSKTGGDNEGSPWKAFENAIGNVTKGNSIEDVLRQQIRKGEYYEDKDGGGKPPSGGGGSGGGPDGSGGSEDEGLSGILDETVQVVLATIGFIFLYIYIISGEELIKLAKDYFKYIFKGTESVRLKRVMNQWRRFFRKLREKKVPEDPYWLEKEIINTPTWWDSPEKYRRILKAVSESDSSGSYGESSPYGDDGESTSYGDESYPKEDDDN
ncbi:nucleusenvelope protein [Trema orientale]|uniref:Nucleusenvelope protein n=1 Tax=Trema orientale TaxID=63057 RepID=A0A2P5FW34_TREOI|nr:nucleusenvelope protein [Trema orientale]